MPTTTITWVYVLLLQQKIAAAVGKNANVPIHCTGNAEIQV